MVFRMQEKTEKRFLRIFKNERIRTSEIRLRII